MSFRIYLEIIRAVAVVIVLFTLMYKGKPIAVAQRKGYRLILVGYALIVLASILDITDNFPALNKYIIMGDTPVQAILEKVVGYLFGFILIAIGFWRWLPKVSELQQTQDKLQEALARETGLRQEVLNERNQLFTTLNSIGDGVISTDTEGKIILINPAAEQLTGWSQEKAGGHLIDQIFKIVDENTKDPIKTPVKKVLDSGQKIGITSHSELIAKDGTAISIADSAAPVRNSEGKIIGVVLVFRDITSEKEFFDEKLKLQKLESIGILAGGIAHDFNNLLMGIQGNINLTIISEKLDDDLLGLLNDADKATQRASLLTQQLLTFSKGGEPNIENVAISKVVQDSAKFVLTGSEVKCQFNIEKDLWLAQVDKGQISQVIENLIINARQAMPNGGTVKIKINNLSLEKAKEFNLDKKKFIHIEIEDTGPGISKEDLGKIFDPYFSTKHQGSGLGLATSYSIIKKHHGYIKVNSPENMGTIFTIFLPAEEGEETPSPAIESKPTAKPTNAGRVLIMDDEPFIQKLITKMLERMNFEVIQTANGTEAIATYKAELNSGNKVDLVILDLTIPGEKGGEETAKELITIDKNVTLIVVSGYSDNPVLSKYKDYGFAAALAKPFKAQDLEKAILEVTS